MARVYVNGRSNAATRWILLEEVPLEYEVLLRHRLNGVAASHAALHPDCNTGVASADQLIVLDQKKLGAPSTEGFSWTAVSADVWHVAKMNVGTTISAGVYRVVADEHRLSGGDPDGVLHVHSPKVVSKEVQTPSCRVELVPPYRGVQFPPVIVDEEDMPVQRAVRTVWELAWGK
jgi:hypothetical protein